FRRDPPDVDEGVGPGGGQAAAVRADGRPQDRTTRQGPSGAGGGRLLARASAPPAARSGPHRFPPPPPAARGPAVAPAAGRLAAPGQGGVPRPERRPAGGGLAPGGRALARLSPQGGVGP